MGSTPPVCAPRQLVDELTMLDKLSRYTGISCSVIDKPRELRDLFDVLPGRWFHG